MSAPASRLLRRICLFLVAFAGTTSVALGQTQWSPSRSTTRPNASASVNAGNDFVPEWQRAPNGHTISDPAVVRTSATTAFHESPRSNQATTVRSSTVVNRNGSTAQLSHDIQLAPGEQLVGQPRYTEGGPTNQTVRPSNQPVRQTAYQRKGEVLPTPDHVSSSPGAKGEVIHEGEHLEGDVDFDPSFSYEDGDFHGGDCTSCGPGGCGRSHSHDPWSDPDSCPECGMYAYHLPGCNRAAMCLENCYGFIFRESSIFAGVQSFKGPLDLGVNGNYGFNEGVNFVIPVIPFPRIGLGWQVGGRWTQSNLSGNNFNSSSRDQRFITTGLYHRAYRGEGFQWGVAWDWLSDSYYTNATASQIRYEFGYLFCCNHELGMWGTVATSNDQVALAGRPIGTLQPADMYNFYYRYNACNGAQARFWGGVTGNSLAILGADFRVPISNRFDMVGGFNYIVADTGNGNNNNGSMDESWNLSMNLVWYFGRRKDGIHNTPFRPLFNVADNGTMMFQPF